MRKFLKISLLSLLLFSFIFGAIQTYKLLTKGFMVWKITCNPSYDSKWDLTPSHSDLNNILAQKFSYIGKGGHCFVFESEDGKYVLKFLKQYRLWPRDWWNTLPFPSFLHQYRSKKINSVRLRREKIFSQYKLAYEKFAKDAGLIAIQLNPRLERGRQVCLKDALGITHRVDLSRTVFILQEKAETVKDRINRLMSQGLEEEAKEAVISLCHLLNKGVVALVNDQFKKNFYNHYGFVEKKAINIDLGCYHKDEVKNCDVMNLTIYFREWLENNYPELNKYFINNLST